MSGVFVYGAGGHGKVVVDILAAAGTEVAGFIDDSKAAGTKVLEHWCVAGNAEWLYANAVAGQTKVALGIGDNAVRRRVAEECLKRGISVVTAIHPRATIARSAKIGQGTAVMAGAIVNPDARIGCGVIINTGAVVEHDVLVGDFAHVAPGATLTGAARIGIESQLGAGGCVLPGVSIGDRTVVGAGAVVIRDLPARVVAVGVPARIRGNNPE